MINDLLPARVPLRYPLRLTWTIKNSRTETNLGSIRSKALFALKDRGAEAATTSQKEEGDEEEKEAKMKKKKKKASSKGEASQSVVVVDPKSSKGPISYAIDFLEELMVKLMYDSDTACSLYFLSGNFAPVPVETPPTTDLPVKGHLPDCLNGEFMRIGPNPKFSPIAGYHWFDGDGMVHGLRIKNGSATYVSRYVRTSRLKQEEFFGCAKFVKVGDVKGHFGLLMIILQILRLGTYDISYGIGTSNTSLTYHSGKLLALHEIDKPYVLKILENGDLQTLGLLDYDKRLGHPFTAHPKIDPLTGEMFTFGYSQLASKVTYRVISRDGFMHDPVLVTVSEPLIMHDFAITTNYAIFMDLPLYLRPVMMVKGNGFPYMFDETKNARFGVLSRYAKDDLQIRWFELPNCYIFHNVNAWEEGDEVVLVTCRIKNPELEKLIGAVEEGKMENFRSELYEMRFCMKSGLASQKKLSPPDIDFPRINEYYSGRKHRYVYGAVMDSVAKIKGIAKIDLEAVPEKGKDKIEVGGNVKGIFQLEAGKFGSEAVFVPREPGTTSAEDDGHLIFFVHDENSGKSQVTVIDARTMSADPVAVVELPSRVPYGFHALFVTEEQIQGQTV